MNIVDRLKPIYPTKILRKNTKNNKITFPTPQNSTFTFIDLFAGIGGFRIALQNLGGKCVFSSEIDKYAQQTYQANFDEIPFGDITLGETKSIFRKILMFFVGDFHAKRFLLQGIKKVLRIHEEHYFLKLPKSHKNTDQKRFFWKM